MTEAGTRTPLTLEELRARRQEILEIAARHGARHIRVFGSVVRGEADESSDVDFLVEMQPGRSLLDLAGLHLDLEDLLSCKVDVMTGVKPRLRERVEAEAVTL